MICLHLASNPGITEAAKNFYRKRLSILPPEIELRLNIDPEVIGPLTEEEEALLSPAEKEVLQHKLKHYRVWKSEEVQRYQNNRRLRPLYQNDLKGMNIDTNDISITRLLGF